MNKQERKDRERLSKLCMKLGQDIPKDITLFELPEEIAYRERLLVEKEIEKARKKAIKLGVKLDWDISKIEKLDYEEILGYINDGEDALIKERKSKTGETIKSLRKKAKSYKKQGVDVELEWIENASKENLEKFILNIKNKDGHIRRKQIEETKRAIKRLNKMEKKMNEERTEKKELEELKENARDFQRDGVDVSLNWIDLATKEELEKFISKTLKKNNKRRAKQMKKMRKELDTQDKMDEERTEKEENTETNTEEKIGVVSDFELLEKEVYKDKDTAKSQLKEKYEISETRVEIQEVAFMSKPRQEFKSWKAFIKVEKNEDLMKYLDIKNITYKENEDNTILVIVRIDDFYGMMIDFGLRTQLDELL